MPIHCDRGKGSFKKQAPFAPENIHLTNTIINKQYDYGRFFTCSGRKNYNLVSGEKPFKLILFKDAKYK